MLPKMRGLSEAIDELHEADPASCFTLHALRKMINSGELPCVRCGRRILVNMDKLYDYLYGESESLGIITSKRNIRPISEKRA